MIEYVWISLGSNLSNPKQQITNALRKISEIPETKLIEHSSYYSNPPLYSLNQPEFINAVAKLQTALDPRSLLNYLQIIEYKQGRVRTTKSRWTSRTLDLDIILFGNYIVHATNLIIPHYDLYNREFMLYPLIELDPELYLPDKKRITHHLNILKKKQSWNYIKSNLNFI
ncbi:2-amino-4-hydroxy-6-hydroxymethyldihydropteridine diphosphokinase [Blochmannia endosymbiont of Colobopsis nipponica]|uniref:2-amino-4-hydroxy-6- hydroxymethyldihydropteridine diphosphokinase n=1 Tax=Blochmannia endosymbiont of Colobopsis nipponica TaxID=2681987 RepID=UPI001784C884|nr:2-amino-4-hydroxy-6-hydroxymethyldihydropteridine diphosphokinase [Blochmannia endosymbiont of Colobopsis nipponica]QOI11255.1 2-amino-4-hydroxy-6-hydroxymethyldihydropteridine diphosphokinase [Blochmannia endosymbiont of Colobopsis nipponica]